MLDRAAAALLLGVFVLHAGLADAGESRPQEPREYTLLATKQTSTMQKELTQAADAGYRFEGVMGGETAFGGKEVVSILSKARGGSAARYDYKLLATNKTSTMQKEMSQAAEAGYEYRGQTVSETTFGGREVIVIMERPRGEAGARYDYKLLATNKTSTMQKELTEAAGAGYIYRGVTVAKTAFGGDEVVVITERGARR